MDGLTISNTQKLLDTGQTFSEIQKSEQKKDLQLPEIETPSTSFADSLGDAIHAVDSLNKNSDRLMEELATGKNGNVAEVMMAAEKADLALKLMVKVRNKAIDAYHEIMRMQV